ncbi:MAG TPA: fructose-bisphosphate aldolase [Alphaproteobacteria bacterium]|nr:fructose-bisphosphate aldolase [Alphaproteobacteria bacterium]
MKINTSKILKNGRSLLLAYDQGLEHGPKDLNLLTSDPKYIFDIALEGMYNGVIVQAGIAEKYYHGYYKDVPLVIKLNGKTSFMDVAPISRQNCSVDRAIKLGASAVGYTIYTGSPHEAEMFVEFSNIVEKAHDYGIPVIAWMYPRGPKIANDLDTDVLAYSARVGLELGADFLKMKYNNNPEGFKWAVRCAGRAKVLVAGGAEMEEHAFLRMADEIMKTGAAGIAVGRNVWQHDKPYSITTAIRKLIHEGMSIDDALKLYEAEAHKEASKKPN